MTNIDKGSKLLRTLLDILFLLHPSQPTDDDSGSLVLTRRARKSKRLTRGASLPLYSFVAAQGIDTIKGRCAHPGKTKRQSRFPGVGPSPARRRPHFEWGAGRSNSKRFQLNTNEPGYIQGLPQHRPTGWLASAGPGNPGVGRLDREYWVPYHCACRR